MMLADGCESAVRARRPSSKQEIHDIVQGIIDARNRSGQLDDSGLTSNDIKTIRSVFIEMLQAVFHPRINYPSPATGKPSVVETNTEPSASSSTKPKASQSANGAVGTQPASNAEESMPPAELAEGDEDVSPLPDVPPLPRRTDEMKAVKDGQQDDGEPEDEQV